jgi:hypothetical protein
VLLLLMHRQRFRGWVWHRFGTTTVLRAQPESRELLSMRREPRPIAVPAAIFILGKKMTRQWQKVRDGES